MKILKYSLFFILVCNTIVLAKDNHILKRIKALNIISIPGTFRHAKVLDIDNDNLPDGLDIVGDEKLNYRFIVIHKNLIGVSLLQKRKFIFYIGLNKENQMVLTSKREEIDRLKKTDLEEAVLWNYVTMHFLANISTIVSPKLLVSPYTAGFTFYLDVGFEGMIIKKKKKLTRYWSVPGLRFFASYNTSLLNSHFTIYSAGVGLLWKFPVKYGAISTGATLGYANIAITTNRIVIPINQSLIIRVDLEYEFFWKYIGFLVNTNFQYTNNFLIVSVNLGISTRIFY